MACGTGTTPRGAGVLQRKGGLLPPLQCSMSAGVPGLTVKVEPISPGPDGKISAGNLYKQNSKHKTVVSDSW